MTSTLPTVAPVVDVLADLEWRGLLAQTTDRDALAKDLAAGPLTVYCGFDPTADSLHVGSLVPLLALRRFQLAGHRPIALAGGATGFIGDPTGRTTDRVMSTPDEISARVMLIKAQMERFLSFDDGPSGAIMADNLDWTASMTALEFLRDVGRHFPVSQMLARESVSARLESGGLSFTEMAYQLLQSLDFVELYRRHGCTAQIGGNDQWGNITAGLDLLRRTEQAGGHALTFPLVTDSAGQKLGKSTGGGNVWLDPAKTSPYALYQFALNVDDRDAGTYLRLLTFVGQAEVEALDLETAERPHARAAQKRLAQELVALVHSADEVERVQAASAALFGGGALEALDEPTLRAALAEAPSVIVAGECPSLVDLLAEGLSLSKSDARRAVKEGGAYLNNAKVADEQAVPAEQDWLHGRFLVLRKGKRNVLVVERSAR
ncbi:MAG: Tyrosine--tRNA ligase [Frankiales bacterium]|nr:Tyrosine--tRNA ligase [Frankiales bacterium]